MQTVIARVFSGRSSREKMAGGEGGEEEGRGEGRREGIREGRREDRRERGRRTLEPLDFSFAVRTRNSRNSQKVISVF